MISAEALRRGFNRGRYRVAEPTPPYWDDRVPRRPEGSPRWVHGEVVPVTPAQLVELDDAGIRVTAEPEAVTAAARDWWPGTMIAETDGRAAAPLAPVVHARSVADVQAVVRWSARHGLPLTVAAGRSNVTGAALPVRGGVLLDVTGLDRVERFDEDRGLVTVQAGVFGDVLEGVLQREHGVTTGHWPSSFAISTVGGWVSCRGAGQLSTRYGKVEDMVVALEVVLPSGEVVHLGESSRAAVGPDLRQLFVGAEGMLGVITSVTLQTHPLPDYGRALAFTFADFASGLRACRATLHAGATPAVVRLYDAAEARHHFGVDAALLLLADEGTPEIVDATLAVARTECARHGEEIDAEGVFERWLDTRYVIPPLHEHPQRERVVYDTLEMVGGWATVAAVYEDVRARVGAVPGTVAVTGHQSHSYRDGACIYFTMQGLVDPGDRERWYRAAWDAAHAAIVDHGATISHHHGVGLVRAPYVARGLGEGQLGLLRAVKGAIDPQGLLNPGKFGL